MEFVEAQLKQRKVVVLAKSYCPFSKKVKETLAQLQLTPDSYEAIDIDLRPDCDAIQNYLETKTGGKSVPRVFVEGKFIGGCDDTVKLAESGDLQKLLKSVGAMKG